MPEPIAQEQSKQLVTTRHIVIISMALLSIIGGILINFVEPLYVVGAVIAFVVISLIFKYEFFGLIIYLVVFLFRPGETYAILNTIRVELILGAALAFLTLIKNKYRYGSFTVPDSRLNKDFLMLIGAMCLSLAFSACKDCTITSIVNMLKLGIFYLLIILQLDSRKRWETFLWIFFIINAIIAADIAYGFYHGQAVFNQGLNRAEGGSSIMDNFNGIAITMNTLIPFTYYLFLYYKIPWKKVLMGLMLILFFWTMILTGSRGGLIGFLAILGFIWWSSKRKLAMSLVMIIFLTIGWMSLGADSQARYSSILDKNRDDSSENRIRAWIDGFELLLMRPLTGVGAGAFAWARAERFGRYLNPHNLYVQVLVELGIIGAIIYFLFLSHIFKINRQIIRTAPVRGSPTGLVSSVARATMISCASLLVTGMFAHSAYRFTWYFLAAMTVVSSHLLAISEEMPDDKITTELPKKNDSLLRETL
jgi:putative inorganic carbon (HCO3(-)) transporter